MKKALLASAATVTLLFSGTAAASATQIELDCTPSAAWTETIPATDAFGTPTITVDNPDYVSPTYVPGYTKHIPAAYTPAIGSPTITVDNPDYRPAVAEVTEVVHHDAVTHTEWKYAKHGGHGFLWIGNDTFKYVDGNGNGLDSKPKHGTYYERTQNTRTVTDADAYDETVVVTPASPAQGEPTITVDNPDYVAPTYTPAHDEWVEPVYTPAIGSKTIVADNPDYVAATLESTIEHEAVVCEDDAAEEPTNDNVVPVEPVVKVPAKAAKVVQITPTAPQSIQTAASGELAVTGAMDSMWIYLLSAFGVGSTALGAVLVYGARKNRA